MNHRLIISILMMLLCSAVRAQQSKAEQFYLEGMRQLESDNPTAAFQMFRHSLQLDPHLAASKFQLSQFYQFLRDDSTAINLLKQAVSDVPDNFWYQQALVDLYARQGKNDEAIAALEQMSEQFPTNEEVLLMLESMYKQKQDYASVINILDRLETKEGKSEALSMEKYRIFVQMDDKDKAFDEIQSLVDEYPNDLRYKVLMGDLYLSNDEDDKALNIYDDVRRQDSTNVNLMASMLNYYQKKDLDSLYQQQVEDISVNPKLEYETRLRFLNSLIMQNLNERRDSTQLLSIFKKVLAMPQEDTQIAELCVRYMVTLGMPADDVRPVLSQMLAIDPECELARSQMLSYAIEEEDTAAIIRVCKPAVDYSSDEPVYYYYLGIAYFQTDSIQQAISTFRKGLGHVDEDTDVRLVTNIYSILGDCYHKTGDMKKVYESFDSCLIYQPDNALVLNNYAYYLSLESKQLDKALEMSRLSLRKEPDNYTYIDTYAWILFQQKRYAEAKEYIDSALVILGDSITENDNTIIEHAGDIYAKNGQAERAVEFWQQAAALGNDSAILQKKLKRRKYYAY